MKGGPYLQVTPIDIDGQPVVSDQQQMVGVDLCGFVDEHRVCHVGQGPAHVCNIRPRVPSEPARVRRRHGHFCVLHTEQTSPPQQHKFYNNNNNDKSINNGRH